MYHGCRSERLGRNRNFFMMAGEANHYRYKGNERCIQGGRTKVAFVSHCDVRVLLVCKCVRESEICKLFCMQMLSLSVSGSSIGIVHPKK